jgi:hypothetical protein
MPSPRMVADCVLLGRCVFPGYVGLGLSAGFEADLLMDDQGW